MKRKVLGLILSVAIVGVLTACGSSSGGSGEKAEASSAAAEAPEEEDAGEKPEEAGEESAAADAEEAIDEDAADAEEAANEEAADEEAADAEEAADGEAADSEGSDEDAESAASDVDLPVEQSKDENVFGFTDETESTDAADTLVSCKTIEVAGKLAGFDMKLPENPEGYESAEISAIAGTMIEVILKDAGESEVHLRKGAGTEDISGDDNEYESTDSVEIGGAEVTEKSDAAGVHAAIWNDGTYAYSITSDAGLTAEQIEALVSGMAG